MASLTKAQQDYFGIFVPDLLDFIASCIENDTYVNGKNPEDVLKNVSKGLRDTVKSYSKK